MIVIRFEIKGCVYKCLRLESHTNGGNMKLTVKCGFWHETIGTVMLLTEHGPHACNLIESRVRICFTKFAGLHHETRKGRSNISDKYISLRRPMKIEGGGLDVIQGHCC